MEKTLKIITGMTIVSMLFVVGIMAYMMNKDTGEPSLLGEDLQVNILSNTEYWPGELGQIIADVRDKNFNPVSGATCYFNIVYPNKTMFVTDGIAAGVSSIGSYYFNFVVPQAEGVYEYSARCVKSSKNYTAAKSFHVQPYLAEFEFEGQHDVKPGEWAIMGWRTQTNGRQVSNITCNIPGTASYANDNRSFYWTWYVNATQYKPGRVYNLTCGGNYYNSVFYNISTVFFTTLFNDTFSYPDNTTTFAPIGNGCYYPAKIDNSSWNMTIMCGAMTPISFINGALNTYFTPCCGDNMYYEFGRNFPNPYVYVNQLSFDLNMTYSSPYGGLRTQFIDIELLNNQLIIRIYVATSTSIYFVNSTNTTLIPGSYTSLKNMTFKNLNISTGKFDFWINDTYKGSYSYNASAGGNLTSIKFLPFSYPSGPVSDRWNITIDNLFIGGDTFITTTNVSQTNYFIGGSIMENFRVLPGLKATVAKG